MARRRKKETYYDRWRRQHPELRMYLSLDRYWLIKSIADSRGISMKDVVLDAIRSADKFYIEGYERGWRSAVDTFIDDPDLFWREYLLPRLRERGIDIDKIDLAFMTIPCSSCGKPVPVHHRSEAYERIRSVILYIRDALSRELGIEFKHRDCSKLE